MSTFDRLHARLREKADDVRARAVVYVALGDSVTQGCLQQGVFEYEHVYHQVLKRRLEQRYNGSVLNAINSGVSGDTADGSRSRWHRDVLLYKPDLVTICFGHNDVHGGVDHLPAFIAAIRDLVGLVRAETEADIALLTPCMMMKRDNDRVADVHRPLVPRFIELAANGILPAYVEALRRFADEHAVPCLDLYAMWDRMEQGGIDIHTRLANGINHPDTAFHIEAGLALEKLLCKNR